MTRTFIVSLYHGAGNKEYTQKEIDRNFAADAAQLFIHTGQERTRRELFLRNVSQWTKGARQRPRRAKVRINN